MKQSTLSAYSPGRPHEARLARGTGGRLHSTCSFGPGWTVVAGSVWAVRIRKRGSGDRAWLGRTRGEELARLLIDRADQRLSAIGMAASNEIASNIGAQTSAGEGGRGCGRTGQAAAHAPSLTLSWRRVHFGKPTSQPPGAPPTNRPSLLSHWRMKEPELLRLRVWPVSWEGEGRA